MEQKHITIGGESMVIQALPAMEGLQAGMKIGKILSGLSEGIGETMTDVLAIPINPGKMVSGIIAQLDEKETPAFIQKLVLDSMVKPQMDSDAFQVRFSGKWDDLTELLIEIMEINHYPEFVKKRISDPLKALFSTPAKSEDSTL